MKIVRPELPAGWQAALAAEAIAVLDVRRARSRWLEAVSQSPDDAHLLAGYATFLTDQGQDAADAEQLYRLALRHRPSDSAIAANFARHLLSEGSSPEGQQQLAAALSLILAESAPAPEVLAELMFYLLAHDRSRGAVALSNLKRLIKLGARSPAGISSRPSTARRTNIIPNWRFCATSPRFLHTAPIRQCSRPTWRGGKRKRKAPDTSVPGAIRCLWLLRRISPSRARRKTRPPSSRRRACRRRCARGP